MSQEDDKKKGYDIDKHVKIIIDTCKKKAQLGFTNYFFNVKLQNTELHELVLKIMEYNDDYIYYDADYEKHSFNEKDNTFWVKVKWWPRDNPPLYFQSDLSGCIIL